MKPLLSCVGAVLLTSVAFAAGAPPAVAGSWNAKVPSPNGKMTVEANGARSSIEGTWRGDVPRGGGRVIAATFEFRVDGTTLGGTVYALGDSYPVTKGTIKDDAVSFIIGETKGDYTGKIAGDEIHMKVKYDGGENGRQTLPFVLKRDK